MKNSVSDNRLSYIYIYIFNTLTTEIKLSSIISPDDCPAYCKLHYMSDVAGKCTHYLFLRVGMHMKLVPCHNVKLDLLSIFTASVKADCVFNVSTASETFPVI